MWHYALTLFLSAFLLFQVQPIIGRYILPWFGGSPAVWTTALLFFQIGLLAGYAYVHWLARRPRIRRQVQIHLLLLMVSLLVLPITPDTSWEPAGPEQPVLKILMLLLISVGGPYLLLSSTSPLLQSWFGKTEIDRSPYRLFALSNLGSLMGLVTYPFLVEPHWGVHSQTTIWSAGYGVFVLMSMGVGYRIFRQSTAQFQFHPTSPSFTQAPNHVSFFDRFLWLVLSASGVILLLAVSNQLTQNVAPIPLLWVLPLALYLLSFILCFEYERWYRRRIIIPTLGGVLILTAYLLNQKGLPHLYEEILIYSALLFVGCVACHGELVKIKPMSAELTSFYLYVALGGVLGGIFVSIVAPLIFNGYWEFHVALLTVFGATGICLIRDVAKQRNLHSRPRILPLLSLSFVLSGLVLLYAIWKPIEDQNQSVIAAYRNFYGVLRVEETGTNTQFARRILRNGAIQHGFQFTDVALRHNLTSYFGPDSGIGLAMRYYVATSDSGHTNLKLHPHSLEQPKTLLKDSMNGFNEVPNDTGSRNYHIGVIGLGIGTLAAYGQEGDRFRFYEINPQVTEVAQTHFSYLKDTEAEFEIIHNDARMALAQEWKLHGSLKFDILVVDAFTGDAIPIHLLTNEAYRLYWQHLKSSGILAIHISNRNLDLAPVIQGLAQTSKHQIALIINRSNPYGIYSSSWMLVSNNMAFLQHPIVQPHLRPLPKKSIVWTDDYSNLWKTFREGLGQEVFQWSFDQDDVFVKATNLFYGLEGTQNYKQALLWFQQAANKGDTEAKRYLGYMFQNGLGTERNYETSVKWYADAAKQGDAEAQNNLAHLFHNGLGVEKNHDTAFHWFWRAAKQGHAEGQYNLGIMYQTGSGIDQDFKEAAHWFLKSSLQGNRQAQNNLGLLYDTGQGVAKNSKEAMRWYRRAAEQGYAKAQHNLGLLYSNGVGVPRNYKEAARWIRRAAEQDHALAQYNLGIMYYQGLGMEQNRDRALKWLGKASDQGQVSAKQVLQKLTPANSANSR